MLITEMNDRVYFSFRRPRCLVGVRDWVLEIPLVPGGCVGDAFRCQVTGGCGICQVTGVGNARVARKPTHSSLGPTETLITVGPPLSTRRLACALKPCPATLRSYVLRVEPANPHSPQSNPCLSMIEMEPTSPCGPGVNAAAPTSAATAPQCLRTTRNQAHCRHQNDEETLKKWVACAESAIEFSQMASRLGETVRPSDVMGRRGALHASARGPPPPKHQISAGACELTRYQ